MSISTFSTFYYGFTIDETNDRLQFDEGAGELTATLTPGTFPLSQMDTVVKTAMEAVGLNEYTITIDRVNRSFSIASPGNNFTLLAGTGSQAGLSVLPLLGFSAADKTGDDTYSSDTTAGDEYRPQFVLQDYVDSDQYKERVDATNNESASGNIESVAFGVRSFFEMSFKFVSNRTEIADGYVIKSNPTGKSDFERFLQDVTRKGRFEFMPDLNNPSIFFVVILENLEGSSTGTGYRLREVRNLPNVFELNKVRLRVTN